MRDVRVQRVSTIPAPFIAIKHGKCEGYKDINHPRPATTFIAIKDGVNGV